MRIRDDERGEWNEKGVVIQEVAPRSYLVKSERGRLIRRNRRDILKTQEFVDVHDEQSEREERERYEYTNKSEMHGESDQRTCTSDVQACEKDDIVNMNERIPEKKVHVEKDVDKPVLRRSSRVIKKTKRLIEEG